jgi:hypothetical protein
MSVVKQVTVSPWGNNAAQFLIVALARAITGEENGRRFQAIIRSANALYLDGDDGHRSDDEFRLCTLGDVRDAIAGSGNNPKFFKHFNPTKIQQTLYPTHREITERAG